MANEKTPQRQSSVNNTTPRPATTPSPRGKRSGRKDNRPRVGGTAVPGAKSTLPKQTPTNNNQQAQQEANSNRLMRRRTGQMGTNDADRRMQNVHEQRQKRIARRKQKLEEARAEIRKSTPGGRVTLGRKNLYFIIGAVIIVLILVAIAVLRSMHMV
ncbi:MAG TPA: hypothetical protein VHZ51_28855 [Ktedonobacteraceae bacterium]|jgi:septin family protein|nr:hypothetical protein [Ktedonobacteraceae bacterium]